MRPALFFFCSIFVLFLPRPHHAQLIEGLVNIKFQPDVRVFAVMGAINAAGFDLDAGSLVENPARRIARERLAHLDPELRERLKKFYQVHNVELDDVEQQSKYVSYSLLLNGPPEFKLAVKPKEVPQDAQAIIGFESLLKEFWAQEEVRRVWEELRPYYVQEIEKYRPLIHGMILDTLRYMRTEARVALDREVIFIPDLLNGYGIVNARNLDQQYMLLVGPSRAARSTRAIRHEYLHFMVDPLITKYRGSLPAPEPFLNLARHRPHALPRYQNDLALILTESLIQVLELRLEHKSSEEKDWTITEIYDQGLVLAPYCDEWLQEFERLQETFQEFVPKLIEGIQSEKEKGRPEKLERIRREIVDSRAKARAEEQAQSNTAAEVRNLLLRGNELLLQKRFDEARKALEQVLNFDANNAGALFGLAQIAAQNQDLDEALELYEQAAARCGKETWIKAWSFVKRGNIYQFQEDMTKARREWGRVQELQGDLRGAAEAAAKALAETRP